MTPLLLIAAALLLAGPAAGPLAAQPKFSVEGGKRFDFGVLHSSASVDRVLRISNSGSDTLRITNVSGSCGCTGTLLSDGDIPPGGSGTLKITFDPAKFSGGVEKVVSMRTNDPAEPNPHITFTATVRKILDVDRTHLVITSPAGSAATETLMVKNHADVPVRVSAAALPPDVRLDLPDEVIPPGGSVVLLCTVNPTKPGILKGDLTISTDHPLMPTLGIRYFVYAKPAAGKPSGGDAGKPSGR